MDISSDLTPASATAIRAEAFSNEVATRVAKLSQNAAKAQGQAAIALLESAAKVAAAGRAARGSVDVMG